MVMLDPMQVEVQVNGVWHKYPSADHAASLLEVTPQAVRNAAQSWRRLTENPAPPCPYCQGTGHRIPRRVKGYFVRYAV